MLNLKVKFFLLIINTKTHMKKLIETIQEVLSIEKQKAEYYACEQVRQVRKSARCTKNEAIQSLLSAWS